MPDKLIPAKLRAMAATSLLILFAVPFAMGVVSQLIVPVMYTVGVIVLIRVTYALISRRFPR
jgi:hypothetical protein